MGAPEMAALWRGLLAKEESGTLDSDERALLGKLQKTFPLLAANPKHPGLNSHEISDLSARLGQKVWQSYLENRKPAAGRLYWVYGPDRGVITIVGLEPHPDSGKRAAYAKVTLSKPRAARS